MSNIDPGVDLTWARTVPQFGTTQPIYPTFSPPQLDAAKAYEAANSVMAGKLGNQIKQNEIANAPLDTALKKAELASRQSQAAIEERANTEGAATEKTDTQAHIAKSLADMSRDQQEAFVNNIDQVETAVTAVDQVTDPSQVDDEIRQQAARLRASGVPEAQVKAFESQAHDPTAREHVHRLAQQTRDAYQQTSTFGSGSNAARTREEGQARSAVNKEFQSWMATDDGKAATPEEQTQHYNLLWRQYHGVMDLPATGSPVAAAGVTPTVPAPKGWLRQAGDWAAEKFGEWNSTPPYFSDPITGGGGKTQAPEPGVAAAKATEDAKLKAGPGAPTATEEKPAETQANDKPTKQADGKTLHQFVGDITDHPAILAWIKGMKNGDKFIAPVDMTTEDGEHHPAGSTLEANDGGQ